MTRAVIAAGAVVGALVSALLSAPAATAGPAAVPPATALPGAAPAATAEPGSDAPPLRPDQALAELDAACAVPATRDLAVTRAVHRVGTEMRVSSTVMLAGFEAGWVESHMHNLACGDRDSLGVFQQRPSQGWGSPAQLLDVSYAARAFFTEAQRIEPRYAGRSAGQLAQGVQRSAHPERYDQARPVAERLLAEVRSAAPTSTPGAAQRFLSDDNRLGRPDGPFRFGTGADEHFAGDWDGDGVDTPGQRQGNRIYIAWDARGTRVSTFHYGRAGTRLVVGDWDGDGRDSVGVVSGRTWHLRDSLSGGAANRTFSYGFPGATPVVGDWDGDGVDTAGVVSGQRWHLTDRHRGGAATRTFSYGPARSAKLAGDWDGDGRDSPGVRSGRLWLLRNGTGGGPAHSTTSFGREGDDPLTGDWDGDRRDSAGVSRAR